VQKGHAGCVDEFSSLLKKTLRYIENMLHHLSLVSGLHVQNLIAYALPDITLPAPAQSHQTNPQAVPKELALLQQACQPVGEPILVVTTNKFRADTPNAADAIQAVHSETRDGCTARSRHGAPVQR
jgi:hypothetical protein